MKKITVLFTVLMLLAASSVFAAVTPEYPAGLNATNKFFTGFYMNRTASATASNNATMLTFNSTKAGFFANKTNANCTISVYNGTGWQRIEMFANSSSNYFRFNQALGNIQGLTTIVANNATNATTYFVPTGGYAFMVGLSNSSMNATNDANVSLTGATTQTLGNASNMQFIYNNGTFLGSDVYSSSNTWDYYAFGIDNSTRANVIVVGQVKLNTENTTDNAQAKYMLINGGTKTDNTSSWLTYNATYNAAGTEIGLTSTSYQTLIQNATINKDRNLATGWVHGTDGIKLFAIMIKNGSTLSRNDITNRAFKMVYTGALSTSKNSGNCTGALMAFSVDNNLGLDGDMELINGTQKLNSDYIATDLSGFSAALADTTYFGVTQSNMTMYQADGSTVSGSFYGKQAADKTMTVGIYEPVLSGTRQGLALAVLMPNPAVVGEVTTAAAAYQNNGTIAFTTKFTRNSTAYSQAALRTQWSGIPSNFTPLTDVMAFNSTIPAAQKGNVYVTMQIPVSGIGDKVGNLRLYKVFPTSAATVRGFTYAGSATPAVDGSWWISTDVADGYLNENSVLAPNVDYYINYVVKDNGNYDYKTASLAIGDPVVLGSVPTSSSSSSSGCVFNPAAGFGLEWLLLMLAPMVAIVRSRFKK